MNYVAGQFVVFPFMADYKVIKYTDTLIYVAIRSFDGDRKGCFPRYEAIAARAHCSRGYVIDAIRRLECSGWLQVERSTKAHNSNRYTFTDSYRFEQIPYAFLFEKGLTMNEKGMLLCLRPHFIIGPGRCIYSIKQLSEMLGLSYKVVHKNIKALVTKGYIEEIAYKHSKNIRRFTDKIPWIFNYSATSPVVTKYPPLKVS
jgi:DNA-binding MarR family transcriptional regulator